MERRARTKRTARSQLVVGTAFDGALLIIVDASWRGERPRVHRASNGSSPAD
jgi:hypothetical protein